MHGVINAARDRAEKEIERHKATHHDQNALRAVVQALVPQRKSGQHDLKSPKIAPEAPTPTAFGCTQRLARLPPSPVSK